MLTRENFQAPWMDSPQHWDNFHYHHARRAHQGVLDLRNARKEVESQLLAQHLHAVQTRGLTGLALKEAQDEVMRT